MATAQNAILNIIVQGYISTRYVNYLGVSGFALVIADFVHTFPEEVKLMWPGPLSLPKGLFFVLRYYILVNGVLALTYGLPTNLSAEQCRTLFLRGAVSAKLVIIASEAILLIRVYAFSGRDKRVLVFLAAQFIAIHVSAFVLFARFLRSVQYVDLPISNLICMPVAANSRLLGIVFALMLCSVSVVMLSMMYLMLRRYRQMKSSLVHVFYQDGLVYFVCLSALACANLAVNFASEDGPLKFLLAQPEADLHAILSTRMLLHLRSWAKRAHRHGFIEANDSWTVGGLDYSTTDHDFILTRGAPSPMTFADSDAV